MSNPLLLNQPQVLSGLGTMIFAIPSTGTYNVQYQATVVPASSLSIIVNQNGSPIYTAPTLSPTQSEVEFKTTINGATADVITVVLSSAASIDNAINNITSIITLGQGL